MSIFTLRAGLVFTTSLWAMPVLSADWPTVHGNADRNGFSTDCVRGPYRLDWVAEFPNEILATRVEAIVADGKVFLGTLNGTLWALDRRTGRVLWKHGGNGSVQHSPAYADSRVFYGDTSGLVWALDAATGKVIWKFRAGKGGFVTTPLVANRTVYLGSRDGTFYALKQDTGRPRWLFATSGPIRCSAALTGSQILFASDDMHAYSLDAASGRQKWKSEKLYGQSFRDYYPVVLGDKAVFRSVLVEEMNDDLNGGTAFLQQRAGIPGGWKELAAFFKSDRNRGTLNPWAAAPRYS